MNDDLSGAKQLCRMSRYLGTTKRKACEKINVLFSFSVFDLKVTLVVQIAHALILEIWLDKLAYGKYMHLKSEWK